MAGFTELFQIVMVVFGIGLVIFVHELGHFIAARLCGVRVETFSLGFGPRLLGWTRGSTMYQIAIVPIGGYVRMAGEERSRYDDPPEPDELPGKGPGQRFLIYSGGVVMNVLFAMVVFPILFYTGVPFYRPVVGQVEPGSPAWMAELDPRAEVVTVNGREIFDWTHIPTAVALGDPQRAILQIRDPDTGLVVTKELVPRRNENLGLFTIGITPGLERDEHGHVVVDAAEGSAAYDAGVRPGDCIVEVVDGTPGRGPEEQLRERINTGRPLRLLLEDEEGRRREVLVEPLLEEVDAPRVGIRPVVNHILAVRGDGVARALGLRTGDRILTVQGRRLLREGDLRRALADLPGPLAIEVQRGDRTIPLEGPVQSPEEGLAFADDIALTIDADSSRIAVMPGEPAATAGLLDGDRIVKMNGVEIHDWTGITTQVQAAVAKDIAVNFVVSRRTEPTGRRTLVELTVAPVGSPRPDYGLALRHYQYLYRTDSVFASLVVGTTSSWRFLQDTWLTVKRMVLRQVSFSNAGGIIAIAKISYSQAESGWVSLLFFLCMLSINLAFINVLPIPVLDGGHLFFLLIEMIKGSPVSDRVLGYSQMVGVVLILSLLVAVTYNDLVRFVLPG